MVSSHFGPILTKTQIFTKFISAWARDRARAQARAQARARARDRARDSRTGSGTGFAHGIFRRGGFLPILSHSCSQLQFRKPTKQCLWEKSILGRVHFPYQFPLQNYGFESFWTNFDKKSDFSKNYFWSSTGSSTCSSTCPGTGF